MATDLSPVTHVALEAKGVLRHGFFTREGGVSGGLYASLNTGLGSDDDRASVLENRRRVAAHLGYSLDRLAGCHQVHSSDVVTVTRATDLAKRSQADALVTAEAGIIITVQTADCGPVLFSDRETGVVGAAHAGWKGATGGVLENTVVAMEALGARRERICAVLGPTISQANYEVGAEFVERVTALDADHHRFFIPSSKTGHAMFDLPEFILAVLQKVGVSQAHWTGHCTYADEARFFSYRRTTHRSEPDYGRQMSAIMLTANG
ncbi:MAG: peptidoglycan editing factor PgeF [Pseudomonadota bacterium]